jgi:hypothetical protein
LYINPTNTQEYFFDISTLFEWKYCNN